MRGPRIFLALVVLFLLVSAVPASAGPDEPEAVQSYAVSWWTVDGGGVSVSSGGDYAVGGTIGQADAGAASGGAYDLISGFWAWWGEYAIFLPLALR